MAPAGFGRFFVKRIPRPPAFTTQVSDAHAAMSPNHPVAARLKWYVRPARSEPGTSTSTCCAANEDEDSEALVPPPREGCSSGSGFVLLRRPISVSAVAFLQHVALAVASRPARKALQRRRTDSGVELLATLISSSDARSMRRSFVFGRLRCPRGTTTGDVMAMAAVDRQRLPPKPEAQTQRSRFLLPLPLPLPWTEHVRALLWQPSSEQLFVATLAACVGDHVWPTFVGARVVGAALGAWLGAVDGLRLRLATEQLAALVERTGLTDEDEGHGLHCVILMDAV